MVVREAKLKEVPKIVDLWKEFMVDHDSIVGEKTPENLVYDKKKRMQTKSLKILLSP